MIYDEKENLAWEIPLSKIFRAQLQVWVIESVVLPKTQYFWAKAESKGATILIR